MLCLSPSDKSNGAFLFFNKILFCIPDLPGTHNESQAGLELKEIIWP